jgi:catechol-2,3-dioxygenase
MITRIAHINLTVPEGSLHLAEEFYRDTLGLRKVPVPMTQENSLAWYVAVRS